MDRRKSGTPSEISSSCSRRCKLATNSCARSSARTGEAIFAKDRQGRYVMINQNGAWMFGKSVEEILGQDDTALFERDGADRIMAIDRAVMRTGKPQTFEEVLDVRGVPSTLAHHPDALVRTWRDGCAA